MNTNLTNDIITRLKKGEDIEDIAKEFTESINSANEQYLLAKRAKAAEEENRKKKKLDATRALIDVCGKIASAWDIPIDEDLLDADPEDLINYFDAIVPLLTTQVKLEKIIMDNTSTEKTKSSSEAIDQFLNKFVR